MADNITITPGTGKTVRTDDIGSDVHVQFVKLMNGADASAEAIEGSTAYGLEADVTRMPVGGYASSGSLISGCTDTITDTTATQVIASQAGAISYITTIMVTNGHSSTGTFVNITDGNGGTILWTGYAAPQAGWSVNFNIPIKTTTATALYCVCVTTGASVRVCAAGYKA